ncbi:hypothetical protein ACHAPO_007278 [Fusarium lateritium]
MSRSVNDESPVAQLWVNHSSGANLDELVGYLQKPSTVDWSADDEAEVERMWADSDVKDAKEKIGPKTHAHMLTLFKICLRVRGCSPMRLISPLSNLRYLPKTGTPAPFYYLYSKAFCEALSTILVHPCMRTGTYRVILTLQYAIMTRIGDCQLWSQLPTWSRTLTCPAIIETFNRVRIAVDSDNTPVLHSVHKEVRSELESRGETSSQLSALLYQIGEIVSRKAKLDVPPEQGICIQFGREVLPLTIEDLMVVQKAIDNMEWPEGYECFACTTSEALSSYKHHTNTDHDIPGYDALCDFFERANKQVIRDCLPQFREWKDEHPPEEGSNPQNQSGSDEEMAEALLQAKDEEIRGLKQRLQDQSQRMEQLSQDNKMLVQSNDTLVQSNNALTERVDDLSERVQRLSAYGARRSPELGVDDAPW